MPCVYLVGSSVSGLTREDDYVSAVSGAQPRPRKASSHQANGVTGAPGRHQSSNSLNVLADAVSSVEANHSGQEANAFYVSSSPHVPKLAYTREWLIRGVIAISALHAASNDATGPQKTSELIQIALTSMNAGLPNLNHLVATISLDDADSCSALAAYSALVAMYALAMPSVQIIYRWTPLADSAYLKDPLSQILTTFDLVRGTAEIYRQVWNPLQNGPIAAVTHVDLFGDKMIVSPEPDEILMRTRESYATLAKGLPESSPRRQFMARALEVGEAIRKTGEAANEACWLAFVHLFLVVKIILAPGDDINRSLVLAWPAILLPEFMRQLREQRPAALALLAVWALGLRDSSWLMRGWKQWIVDASWKVRENVRSRGENVEGDICWDTVAWAKQCINANPRFLEEDTEEQETPVDPGLPR
ncbi:MAG: hypothetical protein Q9162_007427 [Coniocarpon cinnabarinum]